MSRISASLWNQLVDAFEQADAAVELAQQARERLPAPANDELPTGLEEIHAAVRRVRDEWEARLLALEAPNVEAAAYQLRLFALRHHAADLADGPRADEEPQAWALRRIYRSLVTAEQA